MMRFKEHTLTPTRVHLPVVAHSVGIHNILEPRCKFVGSNQRWRSVAGGNAIDKGRNRCSALSLKYQLQTKWVAKKHFAHIYYDNSLVQYAAGVNA